MTTYINDPMDVELFCHADGSNDVFPLIHNVMQGVFEELKTQSEFFNLNLN